MIFKLPKLPYDYAALGPSLDEETMKIHHSKHHQAYVDKLNAVLEGKSEFEGKNIEEILKDLDSIPEDLKTGIRNNGGGHANHSFFWQILAPDTGQKPGGALLEAINEAFGSFNEFQENFNKAAISHFGSGWAWLVVSNGSLEILSTPNQDTPLSDGKTPVLCLDLWEHSYYLKFKNRRPEYIEAWWNVVNWKKVSELYSSAMK